MTKTTKVPAEDKTAARRLAEAFSADTLDSLIDDAVKSGTPIDGANGLLALPDRECVGGCGADGVRLGM